MATLCLAFPTFFECNQKHGIETDYCSQSFVVVVKQLRSCSDYSGFILNAVSFFVPCFCWKAIPSSKSLLCLATFQHSVQIYCSCPDSLSFFCSHFLLFCNWLYLNFLILFSYTVSAGSWSSSLSPPLINRLTKASVSLMLVTRILKEHPYFVV